MIKFRHAMLSPVLDIVRAVQTTVPTGSHQSFLKLWESEVETSVKEISEYAELTPKEKKQTTQIVSLLSDALELFLREGENPSWIALTPDQRLAKVKTIQEAPQIPQRSPEWYKNYSKVLTASEFSALFSFNKRRTDLVYSKVNPPEQTGFFRLACPTHEMNALGWGIRFEPVIKQLLEHRDKCKIFEPGRLQHPVNTHLAASPDGVIESSVHPEQIGRLVEIKCPYSRVIGGDIPSDYWIQMQIQMEVTDIDECEYIEATLVSKKANQTEPVDLSGTTFQGILYLVENSQQSGDYKYVYGDIGSSVIPPLPNGYVCIETIPWGLKTWHRKIVSRDRAWYEATKPWQEAFWNDVEKVKQGEIPQMQTPKLKPATPCLIVDD